MKQALHFTCALCLLVVAGCPSDDPASTSDGAADAETETGAEVTTDAAPNEVADETSADSALDTEADVTEVVATTKCDLNAMVTELCAPDGQEQTLAIDLDVTYASYPAVPRFTKPGTTDDGAVCHDVYVEPSPMNLRTYRARMTGGDWMPASFPGPTLRLKLGDTLALNFSNSLAIDDGATPQDATGHLCAAGSPATDVSPNCLHGFNDTNIHFHGTHVSPWTNGEPQFVQEGPLMVPNPDFRLVDNVYVVATPPDAGVAPPSPDCEDVACFRFPGDQVPPYELYFGSGQIPGTHWYHAHKHGSTALQMLNGLAGALIIEGDFAGVVEIESAREQVLVLQQIDDRPPKLLSAGPPPTEAHRRQAVPELLVNGVLTPTIEIQSGEVQRWRFISATQQASASFKGLELTTEEGSPLNAAQPEGACVDGVAVPAVYDYSAAGVYQVAQDGVEFLDERWQRVLCDRDAYLDLAFNAGNRADFLIVAPETDEDLVLLLQQDGVVVSQAGSGGGAGGPGTIETPTCPPGPGDDWGRFLGRNPDLPLLRLVVKAADPDEPPPVTSLPERLRTFDELPPGQQAARAPISDDAIVDRPMVEFQMNPGPSAAPQFYISDKKFCDVRLDQCMALDTAEEWTITNYTEVAHPFHIHINPFFVTHWFDANDYFTEPDAACETLCDATQASCTDLCASGDQACRDGCRSARATCVAACPPMHDPDDPLPPDAGLLEPEDPRRRWQDVIGLPKAFIPPLEPPAAACAPLLADQGEADSTCPTICGGADGRWNPAAWTCDAAAVSAAGCDPEASCVCSCAPNPAPIRRGFVKVRQRFLDFDGDFVIHCHILGHEDRGMMHRIGVRDSTVSCEAASAALDGADCSQGASVCAQACQSDAVDMSRPLPDICQAFVGGAWERNCLADYRMVPSP